MTTREQAAIICAVLASGTGMSEYDVAWALGFSRAAAWLADRMSSAVRRHGGYASMHGGYASMHGVDAESADLLWDGFDPRDVARLPRLT